MILVGIVSGGLMFALALWQAWVSHRFVERLQQPDSPLLSDAECPPAMILLCLRWGDETLIENLLALLRQDYPNYVLRIMVDSPTDPVLPVIESVRGMDVKSRLDVRIAGEKRPGCSYKVSSQLEGTLDLPAGTKVIAQCDADAVPPADWLRLLVAPIVRGEADYVTGQRWYCPANVSVSGMTRLLWNMFVIARMHYLEMAWGGTMALPAATWADPALRSCLSGALAEDTALSTFLHERRARLVFLPQLLLLNTEDISWSGLYRFFVRHLMFTRQNSHLWPPTIITEVGFLVAYSLFPLALSDARASQFALGGYVLFVLTFLFTIVRTLRGVEHRLRQRNVAIPSLTPTRLLALAGAAYAVMFVSVASFLHACFGRTFTWRGIRYTLHGRFQPSTLEDLGGRAGGALPNS